MRLQIGILGVVLCFLSYGCDAGVFSPNLESNPITDECEDSTKEGCVVEPPPPPLPPPDMESDWIQVCLFYTFDDAHEVDPYCHHCDNAGLDVEINGQTGYFDLSNRSSRNVTGILSGKTYNVHTGGGSNHKAAGTHDGKHYVSDIPGGVIGVNVESLDSITLKASYRSNPRCIYGKANQVLFSLIAKSADTYYATSGIQNIPFGREGGRHDRGSSSGNIVSISKGSLRSSTSGYEFDDWCNIKAK